MANVCCDDVYFYCDESPEKLDALWTDINTSIQIDHTFQNCQIGNFFTQKGLSVPSCGLRGDITYMERNDKDIFLELSTAWTPLYEAYQTIAEAYGVSFVMKSMEPGEALYFNTDETGQFFPEHYLIYGDNQLLITPSGKPITVLWEDQDVFHNKEEIWDQLTKLGYTFSSLEEMEEFLTENDIDLHEFINPY